MSPTALPPLRPSQHPVRVFGVQPVRTDGDLLALGFTPAGVLRSVEEPGVLRAWDVAARRQRAWHALHDVALTWALSPDASLVAGGSDEVAVWDADGGDPVADWTVPSWVSALALNPAGTLVATGHDDSAVRVWHLATRRLLQELTGHTQAVSALAFSADGTRLASAGEDREVHLWDVATGARLRTLAGHTDRVPALVWHPNGRRLYSAGWDTTARVWDCESGEPIILLNSHAPQVHALALSPDGRVLACADSADAVHLWDTKRHAPLAVLRDLGREVRALAFSPDGQRLAAGGADHVVHLWGARGEAERDPAPDPQLARTCVAVSPDGRRLACLGAGAPLRVWDVADATPEAAPEGAPALRAFAASPDGRWVAASRVEANAGDRATLGLWRADTGARQAALDGQCAPITALAFAPDSATLASAGFQSGDVWLWEVPSGEPALLIPNALEGCAVEALAFHPGGRLLGVGGVDWLATSGADGRVALWDVPARRVAATFPGGARGLAFHPGGELLAVATLGQAVRVYDLPQGRLLYELLGHLEPVTCVAYSPDGRWLATGGDDRTVCLWDARAEQQVASYELDSQVKALAFAPDGRFLFTGTGTGSCHQHEVARLLAGGE